METNSTPTTETSDTKSETEKANLDGLVDEAQESLASAIAAFVLVEGADDQFFGAPRDRLRGQFNDSAHAVFRALECIREGGYRVADDEVTS